MPELIKKVFARMDRLDEMIEHLEANLAASDRVEAARRVAARRSEMATGIVALTDEVAYAVDVPVCLVNVITDTMSVVMACSGMVYDKGSQDTYCQYVAGSGHPFKVEDSRRNPLVRFLPATTDPMTPVRAYYGAPVYLGDQPVGAFCVADYKPRHWSRFEMDYVDAHADQVSGMLAAVHHV